MVDGEARRTRSSENRGTAPELPEAARGIFAPFRVSVNAHMCVHMSVHVPGGGWSVCAHAHIYACECMSACVRDYELALICWEACMHVWECV